MPWPVLDIADQHDPWPGWRAFRCTADELPTLPHEWRSMLSHTKGVYLLIDLDDAGKQYVGSAKGSAATTCSADSWATRGAARTTTVA